MGNLFSGRKLPGVVDATCSHHQQNWYLMQRNAMQIVRLLKCFKSHRGHLFMALAIYILEESFQELLIPLVRIINRTGT